MGKLALQHDKLSAFYKINTKYTNKGSALPSAKTIMLTSSNVTFKI